MEAQPRSELVVASLLELYKEQGIDMHQILDDPIFDKLPLGGKVSALKRYAAYISSSNSGVVSKTDVRNMLINMALGSAVAGGMSALTSYGFNQAVGRTNAGFPGRSIAVGAGLGAAAGAVKSLMNSSKSITDRTSMNARFKELANSGSDKDALKILGARSLQNGKVNLARGPLADLGSQVSQSLLPTAISYGSIRASNSALRDLGKDTTDNPSNYADVLASLQAGHGVNAHNEAESTNAIINKLKGMF